MRAVGQQKVVQKKLFEHFRNFRTFRQAKKNLEFKVKFEMHKYGQFYISYSVDVLHPKSGFDQNQGKI